MRILVVTQYYYPEQFRVNDICDELVKRGHEVTVVTGQPNYPDGEVFPGYEEIKENEYHNGVRVVRCRIHPRCKDSINLALNYISFVLSASRRMKSLHNKYDIIYVYQLSPVTLALPAIKKRKLCNIPIFLYCCDVWPESVRDSEKEPMSLRNPIYVVAKWISKHVYSRVDRIGVKCNQFIDYLHDVCRINRNKCCLIFEHAEDNYLSVSDVPDENNCYDFMFLGNIGLAQHCEYIVEAAEHIRTNKQFKIHFVGSGSGVDSLQNYAKNSAINDRVIFHGKQPISEINKYYELADCCVLTLSAKTATGLTPPAKLAGYMAASRPIIAAATGATEEIIRIANCGICVDPDNIQELSRAMQYALEHQMEFKERGKDGRAFFKKTFTLKMHVDSLERELKNLLSRANG